jgi:flagellar biosynthesis protein FlhG
MRDPRTIPIPISTAPRRPESTRLGEARQAVAGRTVAVVSGKGGVGKTSLAVNLALALAENGARVLLVDGDFALGSVDVLCGLAPHRNVSAYLDGACPLAGTLAVGPRGIAVLPSASGRSDLSELDSPTRTRLLEDLGTLSRRFDWTVVDLPSGIGSTGMALARWAEIPLLLTTPDPAALLHAYATAKLLAARGRTPRLVVNRVRTEAEGAEVARRFARTASFHLGAAPELWGTLPEDPAAQRAAADQDPFVVAAPRAPVSVRVRELAHRLGTDEHPQGSAHAGGDRKDLFLPVPAA